MRSQKHIKAARKMADLQVPPELSDAERFFFLLIIWRKRFKPKLFWWGGGWRNKIYIIIFRLFNSTEHKTMLFSFLNT